MIHISIDLETFDSSPTAALATIGAVAWMPGAQHCFSSVVDDPGGSWSPSTIRWHASQEGVRDNLGRERHTRPLARALQDFTVWLRAHDADKEGRVCIWTHATFDMPILESAFRRADLPRPWHYRNCRDLRTLYDLAGGRPELDRVGTHHNALDDAIYQMGEVKECLRRLETLGVTPMGKYQETSRE